MSTETTQKPREKMFDDAETFADVLLSNGTADDPEMLSAAMGRLAQTSGWNYRQVRLALSAALFRAKRVAEGMSGAELDAALEGFLDRVSSGEIGDADTVVSD